MKIYYHSLGLGIGDWGLGIGDWGLGIGDWGIFFNGLVFCVFLGDNPSD
ncbi:hypothetical protein [Nostoc sp.]